MAKRYILFDLGGVLADLGSPAEQMGLAISNAGFWQRWASSPAVRAFELGAIDSEEFLDRFAEEIDSRDRSQEFRERFLRWRLELFPGVAAMLQALSRHHDLALLSNTNPLHWEMIRAPTDAFDHFSGIFLSYEMGHVKPDAAAFAHVLERLDAAPDQVVFLDDGAANVAAARQLGLRAGHVRSFDAVPALLQELTAAGIG